jgi:hypothetical protein
MARSIQAGLDSITDIAMGNDPNKLKQFADKFGGAVRKINNFGN